MKIIEPSSESNVIGLSVQEYFSKVNQIVQNHTKDITELDENCGSWRETEWIK